jgi:hypothetical protein
MQPAPLHLSLLRHMLRPARGGAAAVVIVFAILLSIASRSLFGLPLALVLGPWFFKYAYILFDHTARGFDEPPVLDIAMLNPLDEQRPAGQVILLCCFIGLGYLALTYIGLIAAVLWGLIVLFILPASIAILGLEGNMLKAAYPVAWVRMIHGLGPLYALMLMLIVADFVILALLSKLDLWISVQLAIDMFLVLSIFSVLGGALYERRHEMGLDTWSSPERDQEKERKEELRANERIVHEAYGLTRADSHIKAWEMLQSWLATHGHRPEDYGWLCDHVHNWEDPRYITRLTEEQVARLLTLKRTGEALDVLGKRLRIDPSFRPKTAADTLGLAQLATRGGSPRVARTLLSDFAARFPGDPRLSVAEALARHLGPHAH